MSSVAGKLREGQHSMASEKVSSGFFKRAAVGKRLSSCAVPYFSAILASDSDRRNGARTTDEPKARAKSTIDSMTLQNMRCLMHKQTVRRNCLFRLVRAGPVQSDV